MKKIAKKLTALATAIVMGSLMITTASAINCSGHVFYPKYLTTTSHSTSVHRVGTNTYCTITTVGCVYVDVCAICGYAGPTYIDYRDSHSVKH